MAANWEGIGVALQGAGAGLQGGDGSAVIANYRNRLENRKAEEALKGLMGNVNISPQERAILATMPASAQQQYLLNRMSENRKMSASQAATARAAELERQQQQQWSDTIARINGTSQPSAEYSLGVSQPPSFGGGSAPLDNTIRTQPANVGFSPEIMARPAPAVSPASAPTGNDLMTKLKRAEEIFMSAPEGPIRNAAKAAMDVYQKRIEREAPQEPADEYGRYVMEARGRGETPMTRLEYATAKAEATRAPAGPSTNLGKLRQDFESGLISQEAYEAAVAKAIAPTGMTLVSDGEGGFTLRQGDAVSQDFGTKATNDIQGRVLNAGAMLGRLNDTRALFRPEYQQIFTRSANVLAEGADKLGIATPEQQQAVGEFARFRTEAFNNLNTTLKELSGAAVTPQEAERLLEQLPNVGTTIWNGDSPTEFQAKLDQSIAQQRKAIARYRLWQLQGQSGNPWDLGSLSQVENMINKYGQQLEQNLKSQGFTDQKAIEEMVTQQLQREIWD